MTRILIIIGELVLIVAFVGQMASDVKKYFSKK